MGMGSVLATAERPPPLSCCAFLSIALLFFFFYFFFSLFSSSLIMILRAVWALQPANPPLACFPGRGLGSAPESAYSGVCCAATAACYDKACSEHHLNLFLLPSPLSSPAGDRWR